MQITTKVHHKAMASDEDTGSTSTLNTSMDVPPTPSTSMDTLALILTLIFMAQGISQSGEILQ